MKTQTRQINRRRAFALIIVLAFMALLLVLFVALMSSTQTESKISHIAAEGSRARRIADSAVAISLAQLRTAIEPEEEAMTPKVWTSQPGAIRVHRANGDLDTIYKLYSAASLTASSEDDIIADLPPADWKARSAEFVDLNAPLVKSDGLHFPILDPRAMSSANGAAVEGFEFKAQNSPSGTVDDVSAPDAMRLPMPVRWLYMLKDGTLGSLSVTRKFIAYAPSATANGAPQAIEPTVDNPIVARMAFWVDDESCKININTAAEGAFWDTPRADTEQERLLATNQPTRLEYHRQPGHPTGVCLSAFFLPNKRFHPAGFQSEMKSMSADSAKDLWRLGRLWIGEEDEGTSEGGMVVPSLLTDAAANPQPRMRQSRYAEVGEIIFDAPPAVTTTAGGSATKKRTTQRFFTQHPAAMDRLRQAGGFLTAQSAAPEVTLYGSPRITLWPVHQHTPSPGDSPEGANEFKKYTRYDQTAVLLSTLKGQRYLIQRSEPGNGAMDMDIHADGQNKKLLKYLRGLTDRPVPGWVGGGNNTFAAKYGADPITGDRDSILISMMDYVRSTNFADGQLKPNTQFSILCPGPGQEYHGFGQVSPLQARVIGAAASASDHSRGPGRVMTVSEVALVITCRAEVDEHGEIQGLPSELNADNLVAPGDREIEVGLLVESFLPSQGWTDYRPFTSMALVGGAPGTKPDIDATFPVMKLNGQTLMPVSKVIEAEDDVPAGWRGWGGSLGVRGLNKGMLRFAPMVFPGNSADPTNPPELVFEGGSSDLNELKLAVYDTPSSARAVKASAADLLHVIPLRLPDLGSDPDSSVAGLRLPRLPKGTGVSYPLADRMETSTHGAVLLTEEDIVQSLIPAHADYRLLSGRRWLESRDGTSSRPLFVAHPWWNLQRQAHNLRDPFLYAAGVVPPSLSAGHFIPGLAAPSALQPDFPAAAGLPVRAWLGAGWSSLSPQAASDALRLDGGLRGPAWPSVTGDFDNGVGNCPDGAYTARPDDGNWAATLQGGTPYFDPDVFSQLGHTVPPVTGAGFSAQRMLPSPITFGGLPTGVRAQVPWQTLLFRPQPGHYGAANPPDHLLLDLFWSPVIEPEPISRPFETAGKINLNHQLLPFRYIHRATALHAAMKAETLMAIPDTSAATYKNQETDGPVPFRHYLDAAGTLKLWKEHVFDNRRVFLTPGQICEQSLVPEGIVPTDAAVDAFWAGHRLTGDNTKERPYSELYSRLTTRSNVYRVHYIVETLEKARSTASDTLDPVRDRVTARVQGSRLLRRYLDYQRTDLPDYLNENNPKPLDAFYEWSVEN